MLIQQLPAELRDLALSRSTWATPQDTLISAFSWAETPEGHQFWDALNDGDYRRAAAIRPDLCKGVKL